MFIIESIITALALLAIVVLSSIAIAATLLHIVLRQIDKSAKAYRESDEYKLRMLNRKPIAKPEPSPAPVTGKCPPELQPQ